MEKLGALSLIFLLCISAQAINQTAQQNAGAGEVPLNATSTPSIWERITAKTVEEVCLAEAKRTAGDYSWAVTGCRCKESGGEEVKDYECSIQTLQGKYNLTIECVKEEERCAYSSEFGSGSLTFEEIEKRYGR